MNPLPNPHFHLLCTLNTQLALRKQNEEKSSGMGFYSSQDVSESHEIWKRIIPFCWARDNLCCCGYGGLT